MILLKKRCWKTVAQVHRYRHGSDCARNQGLEAPIKVRANLSGLENQSLAARRRKCEVAACKVVPPRSCKRQYREGLPSTLPFGGNRKTGYA